MNITNHSSSEKSGYKIRFKNEILTRIRNNLFIHNKLLSFIQSGIATLAFNSGSLIQQWLSTWILSQAIPVENIFEQIITSIATIRNKSHRLRKRHSFDNSWRNKESVRNQWTRSHKTNKKLVKIKQNDSILQKMQRFKLTTNEIFKTSDNI